MAFFIFLFSFINYLFQMDYAIGILEVGYIQFLTVLYWCWENRYISVFLLFSNRLSKLRTDWNSIHGVIMYCILCYVHWILFLLVWCYCNLLV